MVGYINTLKRKTTFEISVAATDWIFFSGFLKKVRFFVEKT